MSDKSVIIDGVDVSGCESNIENPLREIKHSCNVRGYEKDNGLHIHLKCKNNPDCYYKQLKRLQAENEELKKLCDNKDELLTSVTRKSVKLQAENAELKADIESRTMCITCERELQNCNLQAENEELQGKYNGLNANYNSLKFENERLKGERKELSESIKRLKNMAKAAALGREKYKYALQEIKELARGLINGTIGGCEDDIGSMLENIITKAEEENE